MLPVIRPQFPDMCSDPIFPAANEVRLLVLDTNIVLDAFVFDESVAQPLKEALRGGSVQWLATPAMRLELARVLAYPKIVVRLAHCQRSAEQVLAQFDEQSQMVATAPQANVTCSDPDDQQFIDLAVAHQATLLSKDRAVLCQAKRLAAFHVQVQTVI